MTASCLAYLQDPTGAVVSEGSELSAVVTEIADVTAGPEEGTIALAKRVYAHLYEGNLNSRWVKQACIALHHSGFLHSTSYASSPACCVAR